MKYKYIFSFGISDEMEVKISISSDIIEYNDDLFTNIKILVKELINEKNNYDIVRMCKYIYEILEEEYIQPIYKINVETSSYYGDEKFIIN